MSELHFSRTARRKARRRRIRRRIGAVGLAAAVLGVPGANLGLDLVRASLSPDETTLQGELKGVTTSESTQGLLRFKGNLFQSRPTPTPSPTEEPEPTAPVPPPSGPVGEIIYAAAAEFGVDEAYLTSVATCESGLDPGAVNPAGYHGLFQFDESTWAAYGYGSIYDPVAQARTAARMLAAGMASRWPNCA
ncbi:MAG TPA: transglycosylase family protein [Actinomycetota bacterium]|nr:transglycosylase family protein [Actinomycetota bacterium]